jgi:murein L,D-transpeptidase YafK
MPDTLNFMKSSINFSQAFKFLKLVLKKYSNFAFSFKPHLSCSKCIKIYLCPEYFKDLLNLDPKQRLRRLFSSIRVQNPNRAAPATFRSQIEQFECI